MEAKELRIGNWVSFYHIAEKIDTGEFVVHKQEIQIRRNMMGDIEIPDNLRPIPLTEDWLLRLGFTKKGDSFLLDNIKLMCEDNNWKEPAIDVFSNTAYLTCIEYVHQLQNLYFCLTNNELTIHETTKEPKETT